MKKIVAVLFFAVGASAHAAITGSVVGDAGKAVAGATVRAYASEDAAVFRARLLAGKLDRPPLAETQTKEDGSFSVDGKKQAVDVAIEGAGRAQPIFSTVDGDDLGVITLQATPQRTKFHITAGGKPLKGAFVVAGVHVVATDASGDAATPPAPIWFVVHPDYAVSAVKREAGGATSAPIEVHLTRGAAVAGRVVNATGAVAHATISIDGWPLGESADDGTFTIAHAPEKWQTATAVRGAEAGSVRRGAKAVELRIAPAATMSLSVHDARGGAVSGARVAIAPTDDIHATRIAVTDAAGSASFGALLSAAYLITGVHPAYVIDSTNVNVPQTRTSTLAARAMARARGRVIDEDKKPIAGVSVAGSGWNGVRSRAGVTNAAGEFNVIVFPPPAASLPMALYASKAGYVEAASPALIWQPGQTRDNVTIVMPRGFVKTVRVIDHAGVPVANVNVSAVPSEEGNVRMMLPATCGDPSLPDCRRTDAKGLVTIRTTEGKHDFILAGPDIVLTHANGRLLTPKEDVVTLEVPRGVTVSGRVLGPDGNAVTDAIVTVPVPAMAPRVVQADATGAFTIGGLAAGRQVLTAYSQDRMLASRPVPVTAPANGVTITLPSGGRVEGRVFDRSTQQPVTDFTISIVGRNNGFGPRGSSPAQTIHSDDGRFALESVTPGMLQLTLRAAGYVVALRSDVAVEEAKTTSGVDIALDRGATLTGRVTAGNSPLAGVGVQASSRADGPIMAFASGMPVQTDGDGRYTIDSLNAGELTVTFQKQGFVSVRKTIEVTAAKAATLDATLDAGKQLQGNVVDHAGHPLAMANLMISAAADRSSNRMVATDSEGAFVFDGLADGRYHLSARKDGFISADVSEIEVPQNRALTVTLESGATLTGRLTGLPAEEIAQAVVTASNGTTRTQTNVDSSGNFTMHGLPDGEVRVDAFTTTAYGRRTTMKRVEVQNGAGPFVDLNFDEGITVRGHITRSGAPFGGGNIVFLPARRVAPASGASPGVAGGVVSASGVVGTDGAYIVSNLTAGDYDVRINGAGLAYQTSYTVAGTATFDIDIKGATLHGRVVAGANGAAVAGARISPVTRNRPAATIVSDSDGHFAIEALADGTYDLRTAAAGYPPASQEVVVANGIAPDVEVRLEQAPPLTILVTDSATGEAIDANVFVDNTAHTAGQPGLRSDTGTYKVWLRPGHYNANAYASDYVIEPMPFDAPADTVRIALVRGGRLLIRARSAQRVRVQQPGAPHAMMVLSIRDGSNGPFQTMRPGPYVVETLAKDNSVVGTASVLIVAGQTATLDLP